LPAAPLKAFTQLRGIFIAELSGVQNDQKIYKSEVVSKTCLYLQPSKLHNELLLKADLLGSDNCTADTYSFCGRVVYPD